ncbi:MAG: hypothetical protein HY423_00790 [Candidatus Lambdaproteobacteria bacterium]|nr:hypothetical protein [Candidatus Lambdaproteobacteria bacterium]
MRKTFHQRLREGRIAARQTPEVMAVLVNLSEQAYRALEAGGYPTEETLKRLCTIMDWNYYETHRLIVNEMIAPPRPDAGAGSSAQPSEPEPPPGAAPPDRADSLSARMRQVRESTGQSPQIIARLLNIDPHHYDRLEQGEPPPMGLLRRISLVYNWNFNELVDLLRRDQARSFQPSRTGSPFPVNAAHLYKLQAVWDDLRERFQQAPEAQQQLVLGQLELIRDTLGRRRSENAPARGK